MEKLDTTTTSQQANYTTSTEMQLGLLFGNTIHLDQTSSQCPWTSTIFMCNRHVIQPSWKNSGCTSGYYSNGMHGDPIISCLWCWWCCCISCWISTLYMHLFILWHLCSFCSSTTMATLLFLLIAFHGVTNLYLDSHWTQLDTSTLLWDSNAYWMWCVSSCQHCNMA